MKIGSTTHDGKKILGHLTFISEITEYDLLELYLIEGDPLDERIDVFVDKLKTYLKTGEKL